MTQTDHFGKAITFAKWLIFKMVFFLEYLVFSRGVFCAQLLQCTSRIDFCMFFGVLIFTQTDHFGKPIASAKWLTFKLVSFLEYLVFFRAVFCAKLLQCTSRIDFCMFFGILIFDPNRPFWQGYSLCKMALFQNGVISGIFGVFSSGFLRITTSMCQKNRFLHVFWNFNF